MSGHAGPGDGGDLLQAGKKQPTIVRQVQVTDGAGVGDEILDDLGPC